MAAYWSTDVVGIHRPSLVSSGPGVEVNGSARIGGHVGGQGVHHGGDGLLATQAVVEAGLGLGRGLGAAGQQDGGQGEGGEDGLEDGKLHGLLLMG